MTQSPFDKLCDAVSSQPARIAIVLGSGMSVVAEQVMPSASVPFAEIPGLCRTTIAGHRGRLTLGVWAGQRVLLFEGRLHYYEGHSWDAVVAPVAHRRRAPRQIPAAYECGGWNTRRPCSGQLHGNF